MQQTETVLPAGANFTALASRFVNTCTSLSRSPRTAHDTHSASSATPAPSATPSTACTAFSTASPTSTSASVSRRPLCTLVRSSTSLDSLMSRSVFFAAIVTSRSTRWSSVPNRPEPTSSSDPWIDVSGVRSSWLITEMNSARTSRACALSRWAAATAYSTSTQLPRSRSRCLPSTPSSRGLRSTRHSVPTRCPDGPLTGWPA